MTLCWRQLNSPEFLFQWQWASGLRAPRYRGAVIIVLTVAVPLTPQGSRELREQADPLFSPSLLIMRIAAGAIRGLAADSVVG